MKPAIFFATFLWIFSVASGESGAVKPENQKNITHHRLEITLNNNRTRLQVRDKISLSPSSEGQSANSLTLVLHSDYTLDTNAPVLPGKLLNQGWTIKMKAPDSPTGDPVSLQQLVITKPQSKPWPETLALDISYRGSFLDPLRSGQDPLPEGDEGVLLAGESYFYPRLKNSPSPERVTFDLTVNLPKPFHAVSQGKLNHNVSGDIDRKMIWHCSQPQEEIFLIIDRFTVYQVKHKRLDLFAFLREPDPDLSDKYLKATARYLDFYEKLIGPYPYEKFALVENALQTGYGMPSFTLLGSRIIRFPWILHTSYPHEILHNWFGNGVYIHPESGNWAEGITTYLSDHLLQELKGTGSRYRFQELMKYLNYINAENDFPIAEFKGGSSRTTQAIGYGKLVMVLNMLRTELGNKLFLKTLRKFYEDFQFRHAGFDDLKSVAEKVSGQNLILFFSQWIDRTGGPEIAITDARVVPDNEGFRLTLDLKQNGDFEFLLPVAITFASPNEARTRTIPIQPGANSVSLTLKEKPRAIQLDPWNDVFRRLNPNEPPPSIGQSYGAFQTKVYISGDESSKPLGEAYKKMANALAEGDANRVHSDVGSPILEKGAIWVLGRSQALEPQWLTEPLTEYGVRIKAAGVTVENQSFPWENHSFVFTVRPASNPQASITWVITDVAESIPGLIRKLPHYSKFGYMVFKGDAPTNILKGTWPENREHLIHRFTTGPIQWPTKPRLIDFGPGFD